MTSLKTISRRRFFRTGMLTTGALLFQCRSGKSLRFGLVTDVHYADREPAGSRFYRDSLVKLREAISLFNAEKVDLVVELGDFKDQDAPPVESKTISYLKAIEGEFRRFRGPVYHVLGNHDMDSLSKEQFLKNIENDRVPAGSSYYSFDRSGYHLVVLDANFSSDGSAYDHGNYDWTDANIPADELEWLQDDLGHSELPTLVFIHQLLDGHGAHYVNNAEAVRKVLQESGKVFAVFQGHKHDGGYSKINSIHYITLEAMVEGEGRSNSRYYVAEFDQTRGLVLTGYRLASDAAFEINESGDRADF